MNERETFRLSELERRVSNMIRLATVDSVDHAQARCRVTVGDVKTALLPWLTQRAGADRTWWAPTVGEQVLLLAPSGELACAVVLPAAYQTAHTPPSNDGNVHRVEYEDGTFIQYDRAAHKLTVDCVGDIEVTAAGKITADAGESIEATAGTEIKATAGTSAEVTTGTDLTANVGANLTAAITGNATATVGGNLTATATGNASLTAAVISLTAPAINITGAALNITGAVSVNGLLTATNVVASSTGTGLATHTHICSGPGLPSGVGTG